MLIFNWVTFTVITSYHGLSSSASNKRARIIELLGSGDKTNEQISALLKTTPGYVAKVKSEVKISNDRSRPFHPVSALAKSAHILNSRIPHGAAQSLKLKDTDENTEERKKLWKEFADRKPITVIIQETGLNPLAVEFEQDMFLKLTERDPYALQKNALDYLSKKMDGAEKNKEFVDSYNNIAAGYHERGLLSNEDFSKLLTLLNRIGYESGIDTIVDTNVRAPKGWMRPPCSICGKPLTSVVVDADKMGNSVLEALKKWHHSKCSKK